MKLAINAQGVQVQVESSTPTKMINGIRHILTQEEIVARDSERLIAASKATSDYNESQKEKRRLDLQKYADPLFFKLQRGEVGVTQEDYDNKVEEIRNQYPYWE